MIKKLKDIILEKLDDPEYDDSELEEETLDIIYNAIPGDYSAINYNELLTGVKNG